VTSAWQQAQRAAHWRATSSRRWLAELVLPEHEREQVDSHLRLHDALDLEVELAER
jgi:hypothetical protein